tara:strand:- start:3574 stop:3906 length:333 start_codon:yes stop_codon:yes gene_type:complete
MLLVLMALTGWGMDNAPRATNSPVAIGIAISLFGLIIMPLMAPLSGGTWHLAPGTWHLAEVFGIHAAPTAVTTLGLALIMFQGFALWSGEEEAKERAATGRELLRLVISC